MEVEVPKLENSNNDMSVQNKDSESLSTLNIANAKLKLNNWTSK